MRSTGPGIAVDIHELEDVAAKVRAETDAGLRPQSTAVENGFSAGVPFGRRTPSQQVLEAMTTYRQALVKGIDVMEQYVDAAEILASTMETVAEQYAGTDAMSAARTADVEQALTEALAKVRAAQAQYGPVKPV